MRGIEIFLQNVPPYFLCSSHGMTGKIAPMRNPCALESISRRPKPDPMHTYPVQDGVLPCEEPLWSDETPDD